MHPRKIVKKLIPRKLFAAVEPYGHLAEAFLYNCKAGFPGRGLKVIGVTGTNGKTTTTFMIHKMLNEAGIKTGIISTVGWGAGPEITPQVQHYTSVPVPVLMRRLKKMKQEKVEWLVLETTSHALAQHRVFGVPYQVAVFTNLTHEHLAYHRTFERYRTAKVRLFKIANRHGLRTGIINLDDPNASYFAEAIRNRVFYSVHIPDESKANGMLLDPIGPAQCAWASKIDLKPSGVSYTATFGEDKYHIKTQVPGSFNVDNSLAALCVGRVLGLTPEQIEKGIAALPSVEGRMTRIDEGQDFDAIVDYAHSPDSFEKLFKDLKPVVKGKLIVVFGSQGGGDTEKRPIQGELAGKYADEVVLTEEDDREEDPQQIIDEIAAGVQKSGKTIGRDLFVVHDRPEAIAFALKRAKKNDTVLFLGKGHEKTIERADGEHPWDEIATARKTLKNL
ncbi:MAG TPA: UDP-N-acetylmuramoyl-L-alanyl-D-glutamate--2,6-diaminopimelate ligase [Candidatus Saccharimonadales bacterium]|nr:UDP-N-acetylmuramoyl-L-alanyl-D-glutamate--2,6-diaminopimelate ligase [Candidatus Saccharimonadales bacterium]